MKIYQDVRRQKQANTIRGEGNPHWKGGKITKACVRCGESFQVYPSQNHHTHCSLLCANRDLADAQRGVINPKKIHYGETNGSWNGGKNIYVCPWCGDEFEAYSGATHKYCSITCARQYQFTGETNPNWRGGIAETNHIIRGLKQYSEWRNAVFGRDSYHCRRCGQETHDVNAHHIKSFAEYPEVRFDVDNGLTLCRDCHQKEHSGR